MLPLPPCCHRVGHEVVRYTAPQAHRRYIRFLAQDGMFPLVCLRLPDECTQLIGYSAGIQYCKEVLEDNIKTTKEYTFIIAGCVL